MTKKKTYAHKREYQKKIRVRFEGRNLQTKVHREINLNCERESGIYFQIIRGGKHKVGRKKQRSAPGPLGDFCQQQLADFLLYFLFLILSLHFLLITSFF